MSNKARVIIGDSRTMIELDEGSVELVVTSPPYWHIKDYGADGQTGYGQTLHQYLKDLFQVWKECYRVLTDGRRLCINIGDQFARATVYGRYKIIPIHAEIISQCEEIGLDFLGSIIWQKKTTMRTSGGATVMGSFPYPPNGIVEIDYEHILIFKKPGKSKKVPAETKRRSKLTKKEWKDYFYGHWNFGGARQVGHEAMFPDELPKRLTKMFTFEGETVLDPFLGSGTTMKVALDLNRNSIGYEINETFIGTIKEKISSSKGEVLITKRKGGPIATAKIGYVPRIKDASPLKDPKKVKKGPELQKVADIIDERTIRLASGKKVRLLGIKVPSRNRVKVLDYLNGKLLRKQVFLRHEVKGEAYVYLKNRIFINSYLIKAGLANVDQSKDFSKKEVFLRHARARKAKK